MFDGINVAHFHGAAHRKTVLPSPAPLRVSSVCEHGSCRPAAARIGAIRETSHQLVRLRHTSHCQTPYTLRVHSRFRILYLLEDTGLSGGVRVLLAQADALIARGHRVTIATKGAPLTWRRSSAEWWYVDEFDELNAAPFDFVVATFWTTVAPAYSIAGARSLHLCQGYEGSFTFYEQFRDQIEQAYALPIPKLVTTTYLADVCRRFHSETFYVGQIVDDEFFRARSPEENDPLRVLLAGPAQADLKGITEGYGASTHARWHGHTFSLVRVSPWAPSGEEPVEEIVDEFHVALPTPEMVSLMHSCDILLAPNYREEGFGLVAAEAMASGIPSVLTRIPSYLSFDSRHDYALFAEERDAEDLGERLIELLIDEDLRARLRKRGREVAEQFRAGRVAERMERYLAERSKKLDGVVG